MNTIVSQDFSLNNIFRISYILILFVFGILTSVGVITDIIMMPICLLCILFTLYKFKNNQILIVIVLYLTIYLLYFIPYFYFDIRLSEYSFQQNRINYDKLLYIFLLFYSGIACCNNKNRTNNNLYSKIEIKCSKQKKYVYIIGLIILFILTFKQGQNVIGLEDSYSAYKDNLENINSIPLILTLYMTLFIPIFGTKRKKLFLLLCSILIIFCVTRGVRMVLVPIGLLIFSVLFENKVSSKKLYLLFFIAFFFLLVVNMLKMGAINLAKSLSEGDSDFIISHHADNLYACSLSFYLLDTNQITFLDRIFLNIGFLLESIVPPTMLPSKMKFPHIVNTLVTTGGGGLFLSGANLMWGFIGVFLFGYFLTRLFIYAENNKFHPIVSYIALIIFIFAPRWMSYDFHIILRFPLMGTIFYLFFNVWKKNINSKHNKILRGR